LSLVGFHHLSITRLQMKANKQMSFQILINKIRLNKFLVM
jgi:hypothetical protein